MQFAAEGAQVVVSDTNVEGGEETVALIEQQGGESVFVKADVSIPGEVDALVSKAVESFDHLDCACNNAGIEGKIVPFIEQPLENFERIMAVNLRGTFLCIQAEIRQAIASSRDI